MNRPIAKIVMDSELRCNDNLSDRINSISAALEAHLRLSEIVRYPSGKGFIKCMVIPYEYGSSDPNCLYILDLLEDEEAYYENTNCTVTLNHKNFDVVKKEPKCPCCGEVI